MTLIARAPWREAVTYRDTWPHEYVVVNKDGQRELLDAFLHRISQGEGVECQFFHRTQKYLFLGDHKYWALQDGDETILNRALLYKDRRDFRIQQGDTGTRNDRPATGDTDRMTNDSEEVEIREVWPNEASDFTPWLAENLNVLSDALNMNLKLVSMEEPVGPFFLDILAKDANTGNLVAIENQLDWTDHSHLGQLLTYAAGCDAQVAVWVAYGINNEHGEAINRLNEWASGNIAFYGVEVEASRKGDPSSASFSVAVSPCEKFVKDHDRADVSLRASKFQDFFQELRQGLWQTDFFEGTPAKRNYYSTSRSNSYQSFASTLDEGITYEVSLDRDSDKWDSDVWVSLYVGEAGKDRTNQIFDALQRQKSQIEASLGAKDIQWMRDDGTGYSGIHARTDASIDDPPEKLNQTKLWMLDLLPKFKTTFEPRLQEILTQLPN